MLLCANSSAMLPVHTFAYYHQVSGKSYYLFLQRDTIRGGLAVKKNSQPWHLSNRHRIAVIPNACWEISQKDLALGLCGPFFGTANIFSPPLNSNSSNLSLSFKLHVTSLQIVIEKQTILFHYISCQTSYY